MRWGLIALMLATPLAACSIRHGLVRGEITLLSQECLFCGGWQGELRRTEFNDTTWKFTVKDSAKVDELRKAMVAGQLVTLEFTDEGFTWPWCRSPSGNIVVTVNVDRADHHAEFAQPRQQ